jgi:hypothetical protein
MAVHYDLSHIYSWCPGCHLELVLMLTHLPNNLANE